MTSNQHFNFQKISEQYNTMAPLGHSVKDTSSELVLKNDQNHFAPLYDISKPLTYGHAIWKRGSKTANDIKCQFKLCPNTVDPAKWEGRNSTRPYGTCPDDGKFYQHGCDASGKPYKNTELASRSVQTVLSQEPAAVTSSQEQSFEAKVSFFQTAFMILLILLIISLMSAKVKKYFERREEAKALENDPEKVIAIVDDEEEYESDLI